MRGLTHFEDTVLSLLTSRVVAAFSYRLYACLPFPNAIVYRDRPTETPLKAPWCLDFKILPLFSLHYQLLSLPRGKRHFFLESLLTLGTLQI